LDVSFAHASPAGNDRLDHPEGELHELPTGALLGRPIAVRDVEDDAADGQKMKVSWTAEDAV